MNIFTFIKKILRLKEINKENKKIEETSTFLLSRHDKFVSKYPNLAIFAFDRVGAAISLSGIFEEFVLEALKEKIFNNINTKDSVCLDVGANIGNHSLYFSNFFNKIYSFEPHPETFELLKLNTRKSKNIEIFHFGLSNKNNKMQLTTESGTEYGASSLSSIEEFNNNSNDVKNFEVQVRKFDDILENKKIDGNISFIKLDVEHHELEVLQGMKETLRIHSPIICLEQHEEHFDYFNGNLSSDTINYLKENQYLYFYEILFSRNWKFYNDYHPILKKIIKMIEAVLYDYPKKISILLPIEKFIKKTYPAIIFSKKPIK
tara:strand:- start:34 stop:987 length:954 start_codon:yes stop_codon:yes gene_type:complete